MERKRIIVAFIDIRGFRRWTQRAINAPEIASEMIDRVYVHFEAFARRTGYYTKVLGDGMMIVREVNNSGHNGGVAKRFLIETAALVDAVREELFKIYPRPDGVRIRVAVGHVWKRLTWTIIRGKLLHLAEYIGYAINMAQSLLYVYPETERICHESTLELIGPKKAGLVFEQLEAPTERRHGVDPADFAGLHRFGLDGTNAKAS